MNSKNLIVSFIVIIIFLLALYLGRNYFGLNLPQVVNNTDVQKVVEATPTPIPVTEIKEESMVDANSAHFLDITSPVDQSVVNTKAIKVQGETTSGAEVFVNDKETKAGTDGTFSLNMILEEGENIIVVSSNDSNGNYIEKEITVTYEI